LAAQARLRRFAAPIAQRVQADQGLCLENLLPMAQQQAARQVLGQQPDGVAPDIVAGQRIAASRRCAC
jgi:hypothetical protein